MEEQKLLMEASVSNYYIVEFVGGLSGSNSTVISLLRDDKLGLYYYIQLQHNSPKLPP